MATAAQRAHMGSLMDLLYQHRSQLDYPWHDVRTSFDQRTFVLTETQMEHCLIGGGHIQGDCSELATEICHWAGLADPNNLRYRYAGYTGSMLANKALRHYTDGKQALVGALVVFGNYPGHHVVMVRHPDPKHGDPQVWSHGRPGVDLVPLSQMAAGQPSPVTFLSIGKL